MKKLMVAACAIAFAAVTHAAQFDWAYDSEGEFNDGATVYVFGGASTLGLELAGILTTQGTEAFNSAITSINYGMDTLGNSNPGIAQGYTIAGTTDYATVFVFQDGVTGGKDFAYYAGVEVAGNIYTPPAGGTTLDLWGSDTYLTGTIKEDGPTPVPEPTSGLMLLLGMGALALRRRRA